MKVALQSASFFDDKSFDGKAADKGSREHFKATLKMFANLRKQVREDANETVDYDEYAEDVRQLLDKHIAGININEPEGAYLVSNLGKEVKPQDAHSYGLSDDETRNQKDKITGRVTKMIEQDLADDPYAQEYFSNLLKKAIEEAKAMFDAPVKQYILFADFEQQVKQRKMPDMPTAFTDTQGKLNKYAQAYFGLFKHLFQSDVLTSADIDENKLIQYAFDIDNIVKTAVAEFSINPSEIENAISVKLLPMLFADLGIDNAQILIEEVLKIMRLGIFRG
jgi:type I restriction enzyme R subunit